MRKNSKKKLFRQIIVDTIAKYFFFLYGIVALVDFEFENSFIERIILFLFIVGFWAILINLDISSSIDIKFNEFKEKYKTWKKRTVFLFYIPSIIIFIIENVEIFKRIFIIFSENAILPISFTVLIAISILLIYKMKLKEINLLNFIDELNWGHFIFLIILGTAFVFISNTEYVNTIISGDLIINLIIQSLVSLVLVIITFWWGFSAVTQINEDGHATLEL